LERCYTNTRSNLIQSLEQMMRSKLLLAVAVVLSVSMTSALAEDCPVKPIDMDAIIAALNAAPD
jgi:hypothetical protein